MIEVSHLSKTFHIKSSDVHAVDDVSLSVRDGEIFGVIGYSGGGKSTLVRCLNLLEMPDSGSVSIGDFGEVTFRGGRVYRRENGAEKRLTERQLSQLRRSVGMIFQHFNLLDRSTVFDNVAYPLRYTGMKRAEIRVRVEELLQLVGLSDKIDVYPSQLSGGQKQRVAIARALANNPKVLLSDEATSALDPDATEAILNLLQDLNRKLGLTIVLITHEMAVIKTVCSRVAVMERGRVVEEGSVYDLFSHPQAEITRRFVASSSILGKIDRLLAEDSPLVRLRPGEKLVRLTFQKDCVGEHIVTTAAKKYGIDLSIVLANIDFLQGSPVGGLIGVVGGDEKSLAGAVEFLKENHVLTEVLTDGVA